MTQVHHIDVEMKLHRMWFPILVGRLLLPLAWLRIVSKGPVYRWAHNVGTHVAFATSSMVPGQRIRIAKLPPGAELTFEDA